MLRDDNEARTVFISYAREDKDLVLPIVHLLRAGGATVFVDLESISYGERWMNVIFQQLRVSDRILVFWSLSAARSDWVNREYLFAIDSGLRVVPVCLDNTPLPNELSKFRALTTLVPLVYESRRRHRPMSWRGLTVLAASVAVIYFFLNLFQLAPPFNPEAPSVALAAVSVVVFQLSCHEILFSPREPEKLRRAAHESVFAEGER